MALGPLPYLQIDLYTFAAQFIGLREVPGTKAHPLILAMLQGEAAWVTDDATAWCSAYVNAICRVLGLPRSRSLAARSWLLVGDGVPLDRARRGDVVILTRGSGPQPGPQVIQAQGHVGFLGDLTETDVLVLGGNQKDQVSEAWFDRDRVLGVRRLVALPHGVS